MRFFTHRIYADKGPHTIVCPTCYQDCVSLEGVSINRQRQLVELDMAHRGQNVKEDQDDSTWAAIGLLCRHCGNSFSLAFNAHRGTGCSDRVEIGTQDSHSCKRDMDSLILEVAMKFGIPFQAAERALRLACSDHDEIEL